MYNFLIVEDDSVNLVLLKSFLKDIANIEIAKNGLVAIEKLKNNLKVNKVYDAIFLDVYMPEINGLQALRVIRFMEDLAGVKKGVPIIMTTVCNDSDVIMNSFKDQCDGYLLKPIHKEEIERVLKELSLL